MISLAAVVPGVDLAQGSLTVLVVGGIMTMFFYMIKHLTTRTSSDLERFVKTISTDLNELRKTIENNSKAQEQLQILNMKILVGLQQTLLAHDLTVTGLNPSTGADFEERDSRAYVKYKECATRYEDVQNHLTLLAAQRQ